MAGWPLVGSFSLTLVTSSRGSDLGGPGVSRTRCIVAVSRGCPAVGVVSDAGLAGMVGLAPSSQAPQSHQPPLACPGERAPRRAKPTAGRTFHHSQPGGCLRDWGGSRPRPVPSLSRVGLSGCLASFPCSLKILTLLGDPTLTPPAAGMWQPANRNPEDTPRTETVAPLSTTPTPLCPGTLRICVCYGCGRRAPPPLGWSPCLWGQSRGGAGLAPRETDRSDHSFLGKLLFCTFGR